MEEPPKREDVAEELVLPPNKDDEVELLVPPKGVDAVELPKGDVVVCVVEDPNNELVGVAVPPPNSDGVELVAGVLLAPKPVVDGAVEPKSDEVFVDVLPKTLGVAEVPKLGVEEPNIVSHSYFDESQTRKRNP